MCAVIVLVEEINYRQDCICDNIYKCRRPMDVCSIRLGVCECVPI